MLNSDEKCQLKDYFEGFTAEEMADVIKVAKEVESTKHKEEYETALHDLVDKMKFFISKYGYLDFDFDGDTTGISTSAILSTGAKPNTICIQYLDEKE